MTNALPNATLNGFIPFSAFFVRSFYNITFKPRSERFSDLTHDIKGLLTDRTQIKEKLSPDLDSGSDSSESSNSSFLLAVFMENNFFGIVNKNCHSNFEYNTD